MSFNTRAYTKPNVILIVDDSPEDRAAAALYLTEAGREEGLIFGFCESGKGEDGLTACRSGMPSCVLLDYYLPDMTGLEFLARLKAETGHVPLSVVMLTGSADKSLALGALQAGAQEYLPKRFMGPEMLLRAIQSAQDRFGLLAERRRTDAALASSEEMLRLSQEAGQIASCEQDVLSGGIRWSAGSQAVIGFPLTSTTMTRSEWLAIRHPDDLARVDAIMAHAYAHRAASASYECRICRPDTGAIRKIEARFSIEYDDAGRPRRSNAAVMDVTERRDMEDKLRASEALLHSVVETAALGIIVAHADGRIFSINSAGLRMFGYEREEDVIGCALGVLMPGAEAAYRDDVNPRPIAAPPQELLGMRKDGSSFPIELSMTAFGDSGPLYLTSIVHDATVRARFEAERLVYETKLENSNADLNLLSNHLLRARDAAEQANQAKSRFLAGMSHELRTPLNGVIGYAHLLRIDGKLNPKQEARVKSLLEAGRHLLAMISSILDLSEIEAGHLALRPVEFDVWTTANACVDLVRPMADRKRLALSVAIAPATPRTLFADETRLRQILLNILGNAVKFTHEGSIDLRLRTSTDGSALRIEIADTGPGITAEQHPRLFQNFDRLDIETTSKVEGAGLGLALSARLVRLMDGSLGHDDNPEGGSVFWVELPLGAVAPTCPALAPEGDALPLAEATLAAGRVLHVLVVDDVLMNRDLAGAFLRAFGHEVTCVEDGAEAVAAVATTDFDVVLMDVRMPVMDGLEATRRIRALGGTRGRVPIVALTAQAFTEQIAECHKAGMDSYLGKPFEPDTLLAAIVRAVTAGPTSDAALDPLVTQRITAVPLAVPSVSVEMPVFNREVFERTASFLAPEAVAAYLQTIATGCESLLRELHKPKALAHGNHLAEAAHALAGSAGMFGFERLADASRRFERGVQSGATEVDSLAQGLGAAIEGSLLEILDNSIVRARA